jgi:hypothetical protein
LALELPTTSPESRPRIKVHVSPLEVTVLTGCGPFPDAKWEVVASMTTLLAVGVTDAVV